MGRTGTTRRHALMAAGATAAGLLTACTSGGSANGVLSPDAAARAARAARALRRRAAGDSAELLRRYDAVLARHADRAGLLTPLRAAVALHVEALTLRTTDPSPEASSGSPDSSTGGSTGGNTDKVPEKPSATLAGAPAVSPEPVEALKELAAAERRTSDAHTASLVSAAPELARLLASVAAANAVHAYLLTEGARS